MRFHFPGKPIPLGRPRTRVFPSKSGGKAFASIYTPPTSRVWMDYMESVAVIEMRKHGWACADGPLHVCIEVMPEALASGKQPKKSGDLDNHIKAVLDALNAIAFKDDSQVVSIVAVMRPASTTGGITVTVETFHNGA